MQHEHLNAFGDVVADPATLARAERLDVLRGAVASLKAGKIDRRTAAWLASVLDEHLREGADLARLLGTKPERGCRMTAPRIAEAERHGALLLQLSAACGGDRAAVRVLAGTAPCPARAKAIVAELAELKGGKSLRAFTRARTAHSA